jgi:hypothetical protein
MPTRRERVRIFRRDAFTCYYCGGVFDVDYLEVDHLHPASWNGTDTAENYVTACYGCNRAKRDRPVVPVTREQATDAFVRSLDLTDRTGNRQYARIMDGDVPIENGFPDDLKYAEARRAEIAQRGRDLNVRRLFRQVEEAKERERLRAFEEVLEEHETSRLMETLQAIRPK